MIQSNIFIKQQRNIIKKWKANNYLPLTHQYFYHFQSSPITALNKRRDILRNIYPSYMSTSASDLYNPQHKLSPWNIKKRKNFQQITYGDIILYVLSMWISMFGLAYLSAPLYRALCQRFGWGGTVTRKIDKKMRSLVIWRESDDYRKNRKLLIRFDTRTGPGMEWEFTPVQNYIITRPGESTLAFFKAHNMSKNPMTGLSTYTVLPFKAAPYFIKIQCFCFEEQRLRFCLFVCIVVRFVFWFVSFLLNRGNEELDMPVLFFVDPAILDDERCSDVCEVTLSYIFYPIVDDTGEVELDDYENDPFYNENSESKDIQMQIMSGIPSEQNLSPLIQQ